MGIHSVEETKNNANHSKPKRCSTLGGIRIFIWFRAVSSRFRNLVSCHPKRCTKSESLHEADGGVDNIIMFSSHQDGFGHKRSKWPEEASTSSTATITATITSTDPIKNPHKKHEIRAEDSHNSLLNQYYYMKEIIGEGTFGKVRKGVHRRTRETVAIKFITKSKLGAELGRVYMEIGALKSLDHPFVCKLYQVLETGDTILLIMEYCAKELFEVVRKRKRIRECEAKKIFSQLVEAVLYVHDKNIVHRDLKLENVLLDACGNVRLIDFNLSARVTTSSKLVETPCGTVEYASPELLKVGQGQKYDGTLTDAWALGVILYTMLTGSMPFVEPDILNKILTGTYWNPSKVSRKAKSLINQLLVVDTRLRLPICKILDHPWFENSSCISKKKDLKNGVAIGTSDQKSREGQQRLDPEILTLIEPTIKISIDKLKASLLYRNNLRSNDLATYRIVSRKKELLVRMGNRPAAWMDWQRIFTNWSTRHISLKNESKK